MSSADYEPGCFWRRSVRLSALVCIGAFLFRDDLFPGSGTFQIIGGTASYIGRVLDVACGYEVHIASEELPFRLHCCLFPTAFFTALATVISCGPTIADREHIADWRLDVLFVISVLCSLLPFLFGIAQIMKICRSETEIIIATMLLLTYVFLAALCILTARRRRDDETCVFWLGLVPFITLFACSMCWGCYLLPRIAGRSYFYSPYTTFSIWFANAAASTVALFGWIAWWRAIKTVSQGRTAVCRVQL